MRTEIADQALAGALLRHLAATRGRDDPLGSLARAVVSGEAGLREAAAHSWHAEGLLTAFQAALDERARMPAERRDAYDRFGVTG